MKTGVVLTFAILILSFYCGIAVADTADSLYEESGITGCDSAEVSMRIDASLMMRDLKIMGCTFFFKKYYMLDVRSKKGGGLTYHRSAGSIYCKNKVTVTTEDKHRTGYLTTFTADTLDSVFIDSTISLHLILETNDKNIAPDGIPVTFSHKHRLYSRESLQVSDILNLEIKSAVIR